MELEPTISPLPVRRATHCATPPLIPKYYLLFLEGFSPKVSRNLVIISWFIIIIIVISI